MSAITLYTLFPSCPNALQQQWLEECINSIKNTSFKHVLISCVDEESWYYNRCKIYTMGGLVGCLDYDDYLISAAAEQMYKTIIDHKPHLCFSHQLTKHNDKLVEQHSRLVTPRDVTQHVQVIHHLTVLNSSLVPKNLLDTIQNLNVHKNIDWICKAYVALRFGALQFKKNAYVWRQHDNNATRLWKEQYENIAKITIQFLKCIAPINSNLLQAYPTVEILED
jgi:hypothetical protein